MSRRHPCRSACPAPTLPRAGSASSCPTAFPRGARSGAAPLESAVPAHCRRRPPGIASLDRSGSLAMQRHAEIRPRTSRTQQQSP